MRGADAARGAGPNRDFVDKDLGHGPEIGSAGPPGEDATSTRPEPATTGEDRQSITNCCCSIVLQRHLQNLESYDSPGRRSGARPVEDMGL